MIDSATPLRVSAPGSLMLFGEHAVLHGRRALVAAVSSRIRVTLKPRPDEDIRIVSALGEFVTRRDRIGEFPPLRFVLGAIAGQAAALPSGLDLTVESGFSETIGFGSSAAVTVATAAALRAWRTGSFQAADVFRDAVRVVRQVQGVGSGADVAASCYGGIVSYRAEPLEVERLGATHPLVAVYSGSKMPTADVIRIVESRRAAHPALFEKLYELVEANTNAAAGAIVRGDWAEAGTLMNFAHGLMDAMGVSNHPLSAIVHALRADPGILGAKISGSGLGDCAVGLGAVGRPDFPYAVMPVAVAGQGVMREEV